LTWKEKEGKLKFKIELEHFLENDPDEARTQSPLRYFLG
jgi:hypothetical protein